MISNGREPKRCLGRVFNSMVRACHIHGIFNDTMIIPKMTSLIMPLYNAFTYNDFTHKGFTYNDFTYKDYKISYN
jgi:hypothetical protein